MLSKRWCQGPCDYFTYTGFNHFYLNRKGKRWRCWYPCRQKTQLRNAATVFYNYNFTYWKECIWCCVSPASEGCVLHVKHSGNSDFVNNEKYSLILGGDFNVNMLETLRPRVEFADVLKLHNMYVIDVSTLVMATTTVVVDLLVTNCACNLITCSGV